MKISAVSLLRAANDNILNLYNERTELKDYISELEDMIPVETMVEYKRYKEKHG